VASPVILLDLNMPQLDGMLVLNRLLQIDPDVDVAMLTADYNPESAVQAIKKGACDYLVKPITAERIRNASAGWSKKHDGANIAHGAGGPPSFDRI